ncbi:DUF3826 domain-containing protein [Hymenobacter sp. 5317J-9]|uniref:DUF3826 domain-containing protein n=1 Tax=Hymenobacter sp. 5317J-9 TaxID=2932250 RepID=UPI001FD6F91E|nr:DUF3826 domain-containing protein [Hymenobacter sp. 5317J-9]UOQ97818.1 DUF3826 domain-containing protein [Hymenobacter sp. 5317J-9]
MKKPAISLVLLLSLGARAACCQAPASPAPSAAASGKADQEIEKKAADWVASLNLNDARKQAAVQQVIVTHLTAIRDYHNAHPYTEMPAGLNPGTDQPLSVMDRTLIAVSAMPKSIHDNLMAGLRQQLTPEQVEAVLDKYTIGKVAFTLNGYKSIVPDLTPTEEAVIVANLKQAREQAVDFKNMKEISAVFEIYKNKNEDYLNTHGRNWRELFKAYVDAANAKKAADKARAATAPAAAPK